MTPRYQNYFSNSIFLGRYGNFDLYCCPDDFYFSFVAVRNNNVYWQISKHPAVREAMKRAQQLLGYNYN